MEHSRLTGCIFGILLTLAGAAAAETPMRSIIQRLGEEFIVPRYQMLAESATRLSAAVTSACAAPTPETIQAAETAYHATADIWSRLEFIRQGPLEADNAYERLSFWPDRRNSMTRALAQLTAGPAGAAVTPEAVRAEAVSVQGLTALERLVFSKETFVAGARACPAAVAIAQVYAETTRMVADRWPGQIAADAADAGMARDAVSRFVTDLQAEYHFIVDTKLRKPLGRDGAAARPETFEGVRADRTVRALQMNLAGIDEALRAITDETDPKVKRILGELADARVTLEDVPDLATADEGEDFRLRSERLIAAIRRLQQTSYDELPAVVGITLGFNALDGD